jgi:hypothetical protein
MPNLDLQGAGHKLAEHSAELRRRSRLLRLESAALIVQSRDRRKDWQESMKRFEEAFDSARRLDGHFLSSAPAVKP